MEICWNRNIIQFEKDLLIANPTVNLILPSSSLNVSLSAHLFVLKTSRDGDATEVIRGLEKQ